jgi:hypothetical protein
MARRNVNASADPETEIAAVERREASVRRGQFAPVYAGARRLA